MIWSLLFICAQFALLETSSVDDDLAQMKKEISGSSSVCINAQTMRRCQVSFNTQDNTSDIYVNRARPTDSTRGTGVHVTFSSST